MDNISTLATFFGWCTVINIGLLVYVFLMFTLFKSLVVRIHNAIFGLEQENLDVIYFNFLGNYKLAILMLNLVPYCALKIMS